MFVAEDEVTVGKFYATFLIQDYFRRFKKKKETKLAVERLDEDEDLSVSLQVTGLSILGVECRSWFTVRGASIY